MVAYAKTIIFIGNWMDGAAYSLKGGRLKMTKKGTPKFVHTVDEVTMNGRVAIEEGRATTSPAWEYLNWQKRALSLSG